MNVFRVHFDGGTDGDNGYGSYEVLFNGFSKRASRIPFNAAKIGCKKITCNMAEYLSLMSALVWIQSVKNKQDYVVEIFGDSQLVLRQMTGNYKVRAKHLLEFQIKCRQLLRGFRVWTTHWHGRINNVRRFGH